MSTYAGPQILTSPLSIRHSFDHASHLEVGCQRCGSRAMVNDLLAGLAEFVGTFMFLFLAFQGASSALANRQISSTDSLPITDNATVLYIATCFGFSLMVTVWIFFRISGAALNPAVTFGLWLIGGVTSRRGGIIVLSQLVGGIAAAAVSKALTVEPFVVENSLGNGYSKGQGLALELFTTSVLVFTVLLLAAEKSKTTFLTPVAVGLAVFVGHLASIRFTDESRTLGPSVVNAHFETYSYVYFIGQFLGSLVATIFYVILKQLRYGEVVAGIDTDDAAASTQPATGPLMRFLGFGESVPAPETRTLPSVEYNHGALDPEAAEPKFESGTV